MAKPWAKAFYTSDKWRACRSSYIAERILNDGGMCEICHKTHGELVHHKEMLDEGNINNPDVTLNHDNLLFVCKKCHDHLPGHGIKGQKVDRKYFFDENGNFFMNE